LVIKIIVFDVNNFHSVGEFDGDDFFSLNTLVNGDQVQFRFFFLLNSFWFCFNDFRSVRWYVVFEMFLGENGIKNWNCDKKNPSPKFLTTIVVIGYSSSWHVFFI
jgi:hypothetical protein